jgi:hypothetical protein
MQCQTPEDAEVLLLVIPREYYIHVWQHLKQLFLPGMHVK